MSHNVAMDYLRPPEESLAQMHPEIDSSIIVTNRPPVRLVFFAVNYTPEEKDMAQKVFNEILKDPDYTFPAWWTVGDTLRFLHEFEFNEVETIKRIKAHLRWLTSLDSFVITDKMMYALDNGLIYQLGRDRQYRPIVIINLNKLIAVTENKQTLIDSTLYLLILVREVMCIPYHVERWDMLIDCSTVAFAHGLLEFLDDLADLIRTHFPRTIEWIFMFNSSITQELGNKFRPFPQGFDKRRQIFIKNKFDPTLKTYISPDQLEHKFGGEIDDLQEDFWPPLATTFLRSGIRPESLLERKLFYFRMTHFDIFNNVVVQQTSTDPYNPLRKRKELRYVERPNYKCSLFCDP
jgi:hypothetical protein